MTKPMRVKSRAKPHKLKAFGVESGQRVSHARVSHVQQHRGEECHSRGRPDLGGRCREKSGSKVARRNNATSLFAWCIPRRGVRVVTSPLFSPIKYVKTATWSRSVNSEDFLVAEADHVQIQPSARRDLPRDTPSRSKRQPRQHLLSELATISDVTVLQMGHCADHERTQAQQTDGFS